jgi:hypothetical protein
MIGKALLPGVSRRFGKTAELILWPGARGKTCPKSVNCGEILPNSYDLEQAGICGTQGIPSFWVLIALNVQRNTLAILVESVDSTLTDGTAFLFDHFSTI